MIAAFAEGVESAVLPCSLALILPGAVVTLAGRGVWTIPVGYAAGVAVAVWAKVAGIVTLEASGSAALAAGLLLGGGAVIAFRHPHRWGWVAGASAGIVAAAVWRPCVGAELGSILNSAPEDPVGVAPGLAAYLAGLLLLVAAIAVVTHVVDSTRPWVRSIATGAVALGVGMGLLVAAGLHHDATGLLFRWSV